MNLNEEIRLVGMVATFRRPGDEEDRRTNVYYGFVGDIAGKRRLNPEESAAAGYFLPSDCGVQSGDLLTMGGQKFLVMNIVPRFLMGDIACYAGQIYQCNAVITVYGPAVNAYNPATKNSSTVISSGVHCYIETTRSQGMDDDMTLVVQKYRGRVQPFVLYAQESAGITKTSIIKDSEGHTFRVSNDFDVFTSAGILRTSIIWDN